MKDTNLMKKINECKIKKVSHVFNMSLDENILPLFDIKYRAGDPIMFIPGGVHIRPPTVFPLDVFYHRSISLIWANV
jgi:hypothetical protein